MSSVSEEKKTRQRIAARWRDVKRETKHIQSANTDELRARYLAYFKKAAESYLRHVETLRSFPGRAVEGGYVQPSVQAKHAEEKLWVFMRSNGFDLTFTASIGSVSVNK